MQLKKKKKGNKKREKKMRIKINITSKKKLRFIWKISMSIDLYIRMCTNDIHE